MTSILSSFDRHGSTDYPSVILRSSSLAIALQLPSNLDRFDVPDFSSLSQ